MREQSFLGLARVVTSRSFGDRITLIYVAHEDEDDAKSYDRLHLQEESVLR